MIVVVDVADVLEKSVFVCSCRLREREERCRRREPWSEEQQLGRLQERLSERDQLIKQLVVRTVNALLVL